ncbi:MAG: efflux RND transporter periplasmic adaptor subunit [Candidatus Binatia bacterium]
MNTKQTITIVSAAVAGILSGALALWYTAPVDSAATETRTSNQRQERKGAGIHQKREEKGALHAGKTNEGKVHLKPEQIERLGIRVGRLKAGSARATITRPATVAFDLDRIARVGPLITAKVVRVTKDLGDIVKRGEVVAVMESVQLGLARTRYLATRARLETERANYEREKILYAKHIASEASMLEARARFREAQANLEAARETLRVYGLSREEIEEVQPEGKTPLSYYYLRSPMDGMIQRRELAAGETIEPSETPVLVVDTSRVWIMVDAFESEAPLVKVGQKIELTVHSLPGRTFRGRINWVSRELEKKTRTLRARAVVKNPGRVLRAGVFGHARIYTGQSGNAALAPVDAVQTIGKEKIVFVPGKKAGRFEPVPVILGAESDGMVEIVSGVKPGDRIVTGGAFSLKSALTASSRSADEH